MNEEIGRRGSLCDFGKVISTNFEIIHLISDYFEDLCIEVWRCIIVERKYDGLAGMYLKKI